MNSLVEHFQPLFDRIADGALERELDRTLPYEQVRWLADAGFTKLQVPAAYGGQDISVSQLVELLIPLATADSNLVQILHAHFGFTPLHVLNPQPISDWWLTQVGQGNIISNGMVGGGEANDGTFTGTKVYTTGALFADEMFVVTGRDDAGMPTFHVVSTAAVGVERIDDWDGIGQRLTASGTTHFNNVGLDDSRKMTINTPTGLMTNAFVVLIHAAAQAGIAAAAVEDAAGFVRNRSRTYGHALAEFPKDDPLVQEVVGRARIHAQAAADLVKITAQDFDVHLREVAALSVADDTYWELYGRAVARVQATTVSVSEHVLEATQLVYEVGGASILQRTHGFDRHWRNARVFATHNPAHYKLRGLGDYQLNGTIPPVDSWARPSRPFVNQN